MDFAQEVKSRVDIVEVIGARVRLRKNGPNSFKGLCPFHTEKTPSFNVSPVRQGYHCFGCNAGGDVFKFVMELEGLTFFEALKELAERHGIPMPKRAQYVDDTSRLREAIYQMHDLAAENFRANLNGPNGEVARSYLAKRGVKRETIEQFGLGYSDRSGRALLRFLEQRGFSPAQQVEASLAGKRDSDGSFYDYFRGRLMFPIHNERGKVIGFGGRGLSDEDVPKYLNSRASEIYEKNKVLYNLNRAKDAIRSEGSVILVEGYMDALGVTAAGVANVVASCGTALTAEQVRSIHRHTDRIVVNFDPDAAGARASERSIGILLEQGLRVTIMELDGELDPDEYCKERGVEAYRERLVSAKGYFHWLADRVRRQHDLRTTEGQVAVLKQLVPAVQNIPDRLERMQIAIEVAGYVGVDQANQPMVLDAFKKTVADRNERPMQQPAELVRPDEKGLLLVLLSDIDGRQDLVPELGNLEVLQRVAMRRIFAAVLAVHAAGLNLAFDEVNSRLEENDQKLLAITLFTADSEAHELTLEFGRQCVESLRRSDVSDRRQELKKQVKDAERAGRIEEALRLARELQNLERKNGRSS